MGNIPIANVDTTGGTSTITYVTADQLGTPRAIADGSGNTIWQRAYQGNPWNEVAPTSNGYVYNLGFPGQYFDVETGLNYNGFRDYDSGSGREIQSDPKGLFGGQISTYAYGNNSPLMNIDPLGLESPRAACGGNNNSTSAWTGCSTTPPPCTDPCGCKSPNLGLAATIIGTEIVGGGPEDPLADAAVAEEIAAAEAEDAAVTAYADTTAPGANVTNITTDATADQAGATLESNGYTATTSADGQATIYTNAEGDTYIVRPSNSAPGGQAMDFYPGNGNAPVKINFGGPPHQP